MPKFVSILSLVAFNLNFFAANAQGITCPPNLDFELGNFTNWQCLEGYVEGVDGAAPENVLYLNPTAPTGEHTMIAAGGSGERDFFGQFPKSCPNGSGHSVMLGDFAGGHRAAGIYYTFKVPEAAKEFSITYYYAVVLETPNHADFQNPRFRARVIDVATDSELDCVSFDFVASSSLPGFKISPAKEDVVYKDWTPITVNLTKYAGKTLKLEFIVSDCTFNQHFGYAYVDVNTSCSNSLATASLCEGDQYLTLNGPYGFKSYQWFLNHDYNTTVSDSINYFVNPVPSTAKDFALIVTPYPGYGCIDTFIAPVKWQPKPVFDAGTDQQIPCGNSIQLGSPPNSDYLYTWRPADNISNPNIANPTLNKYVFSSVKLVVTVTDKNTSCTITDSISITPVNCFLFIPTAFTPNGDGLNDKLIPHLGGTKGLKRFSVFNRYGNLVFTTTEEGIGWDGTYRGSLQDNGVFIWMLEYIADNNKLTITKGTTMLLR